MRSGGSSARPKTKKIGDSGGGEDDLTQIKVYNSLSMIQGIYSIGQQMRVLDDVWNCIVELWACRQNESGSGPLEMQSNDADVQSIDQTTSSTNLFKVTLPRFSSQYPQNADSRVCPTCLQTLKNEDRDSACIFCSRSICRRFFLSIHLFAALIP
jgi:hypothetical protein